MTSTTLDVTLCLLLVSAAAFTVVTAEQPPSVPAQSRADATANVLATSTASVNYTLAPGAGRGDDSSVRFGRTRGPAFRRTARGTLAGLLADVTVGSAEIDGVPLSRMHEDFRRGVTRAVVDALADPARTQVVAVWRPYPSSSLAARTVVGAPPPPDARVRAATVDVPSGLPATRDEAVVASDAAGDHSRTRHADEFDAVADVVATNAVTGLFPERSARINIDGGGPSPALARTRYRRTAAFLGVTLDDGRDDELDAAEVGAANDRLAAALSDRTARELRAEFETPADAARAVRLGRVRVIVRRW